MSHYSNLNRARVTTAAIAVLAFGLGLAVAQTKGHTRVARARPSAEAGGALQPGRHGG